MKHRFQSLLYYSIPESISLIFRKRSDLVISLVLLSAILIWSVL